jgi:phosphatidylglycerol:prolipoprotein diacylglycerol transferase
MPNFPFGLTMGMLLSAPMILVGAWLIWRGLNEPLPTEPAVPAGAPKKQLGADEPA